MIHYNSMENPMDKAMIQLFGSQLIIFVIQVAFLFVGFFYWTWHGVLERRRYVNARQTASIDNALAPNIGTPPELIKALPSQKYVRCKKLNDKIPEKCVICLESYHRNPVFHVYHVLISMFIIQSVCIHGFVNQLNARYATLIVLTVYASKQQSNNRTRYACFDTLATLNPIDNLS